MIPSSRLGFLRGVFLANYLASRPTDNLNKTTNDDSTFSASELSFIVVHVATNRMD